MESAEEHHIAQEHQAFDVMAIAGLQGMADGVINWGQTRGCGVEGGGNRPIVEAPEIAVAHLHPMAPVHRRHELPPADDLTQKSLQ